MSWPGLRVCLHEVAHGHVLKSQRWLNGPVRPLFLCTSSALYQHADDTMQCFLCHNELKAARHCLADILHSAHNPLSEHASTECRADDEQIFHLFSLLGCQGKGTFPPLQCMVLEQTGKQNKFMKKCVHQPSTTGSILHPIQAPSSWSLTWIT